MKNLYKHTLVAAAVIFLAACSTEDDLIEERKSQNPEPTGETTLTGDAGTADFTNYVAIGNSLTAGLMDAALYTRSQQHSYPNLLAGRFALAGGGEFNQPDIETSAGFNISYNDISQAFNPEAATYGRLVLDLSIPGPVPTAPGEAMNMIEESERASINNLGVPGMRMIEVAHAGYGQLNPFYTRFTTDMASGSVLTQALAKQPTFITYWLGSNDVLSWARGGGLGPDGEEDQTQDAQTDALVSTASFGAALNGSVGALFQTYPNLKGVIANVPNVTLMPYFQAVAYNAIPMDSATALVTSTAYSGYNSILDLLASETGGNFITAEEAAYRKISFSAGANAVVINDDQMTDLQPALDNLLAAQMIDQATYAALMVLKQARQMKSAAEATSLTQIGLPAEILTLNAGSVLGTLADPLNPLSVIGVGVPLDDSYTLTADELVKLVVRITTFNAQIASVADTYEGLALFDVNSFMVDIAVNGGVTANGVTYAPDFSPNGIFSVDGLHPNPVGQGILTNQFMEVIEDSFGATLPSYDVTEFTTVLVQ